MAATILVFSSSACAASNAWVCIAGALIGCDKERWTKVSMAGLHAGDTLDHYRVENLVARSGMASIFKATDLRSGQSVALKIPHPEMEADVVLYDRFQREQDIGRKLDHPFVMKVMFDDDRSQVYMVMEWVEGRLLRQLLRDQGKLPAKRAVDLTIKIAQALDYIHTHGV